MCTLLLMAILLSLLLKLGGDIGWITLVQCLAGLLGLRSLILAISDYFQIQKKAQDVMATAIIVLLSSPLTPLSIYLVTFWKDTWLAIIVIWIVSLILHLQRSPSLQTPRSAIQLIGLVLLISFAALVRHNAIVVLPFILMALVGALRMRGIKWVACLVIALIPVMIILLLTSLQYSVLGTKRLHPELQIYAIDLVGMAVLSPELLDDLPFTSAYLHTDYASDYVIGDRSSVYIFGSNPVVDQEFVSLENTPKLRSEFLLAIREQPITWLRVKWMTFSDFIRPAKDRYGFHTRIEPNDFGLSLNENYRAIRGALFVLTHAVETRGAFKWFSFAHVIWMALTGAAISYFLFQALRRKRSDHHKFLVLLLLIPFGYYFSYLLAIIGPDFRFMYPATILSQGILLTLAAVALARFIKPRQTNQMV